MFTELYAMPYSSSNKISDMKFIASCLSGSIFIQLVKIKQVVIKIELNFTFKSHFNVTDLALFIFARGMSIKDISLAFLDTPAWSLERLQAFIVPSGLCCAIRCDFNILWRRTLDKKNHGPSPLTLGLVLELPSISLQPN